MTSTRALASLSRENRMARILALVRDFLHKICTTFFFNNEAGYVPGVLQTFREAFFFAITINKHQNFSKIHWF